MWSPKFPRKHQSEQIKSNFCPFLPKICPDCLKIRHEGSEMNGSPLLYGEQATRDTPPIWGATRALHPHNFSHQKYRKKSPCLGWEKFRKKFVGKCFGEENAPNLVERGRGTLKYERIKFGAKIVGLFGNARGEFFHFVFVP